MKKIEEIKNICISVFYIVLIISIIVFTINYALVDWEEVSEEFSESMEELAKSINCEIDYKDFHYKGMCIDREDILNFLESQYNNSMIKNAR